VADASGSWTGRWNLDADESDAAEDEDAEADATMRTRRRREGLLPLSNAQAD